MREGPAAGAAPVAALLLEFLKEPAKLRPAFIHRHRELPRGDHVFRFAQARFPHAVLRDFSAAQRDSLHEAAIAFIRQVCLRDGASYYHVLCLPEDATSAEIKENYHLLVGLIHPDRQEGGAPWPADAAPRVNGAYAVLSDPSRRAAYNHDVHRSTATPRPMAPMEQPRVAHARAFAFLRRPVAVVSGVVLSLLALQVWWTTDVSRQYSMLERSLPTSASFTREAGTKPRFLDQGTPVAAASRASPDESESMRLLAPILRALGASIGSGESRPADARAVPAPAARAKEPSGPEAAPAPIATSAAAVASSLATTEIADSRVALVAKPIVAPNVEAPSEGPVTLAQAPQSPPAPTAAQASSARAIANEEIEKLVIRLISAYEAGDIDRLMALADLGFFESMRVRSTFTDFFQATKRRSLQLERLAWRDSDGHSHAQGEATLVADYAGDQSPTTRKVPVELDIVMREGKPRITRLVLFPNGQ